MKNYKKLYKQEIEENTELKIQINELKKQIKEKNAEPYSVDVCFDGKGENFAHIDNVVKHETNYKGFPDCRAENWKITTADGLVSVFKYDEVKCVLAYREDNGKKPKINYKGKSHDGTREITEYSCANCDFEVNKGMNYCYKCGNKIDWS